MPVALVFVDGVGIGERDPARNPLARRETLLSQFSDGSGVPLPRGGRVDAIDVTLGVAGRPQSATGHTALLTGENAAAVLGRHLLGYPNAALRALLAERSVFHRLKAAGRSGLFANGYPLPYLDALGLPHTGPPSSAEALAAVPARWKRRLKPAAAPFAYAAAGHPLSTFDDVRRGRALTHDLTSALGRARDPALALRTPAEAAEIFARLAGEADFALVDYFRTDDAGHAQDFAAADGALADLDGFLRALVERLPATHSLAVVSDHGNLEDLSLRNHTLADVALLRWGPIAALPAPRALDGVLPLLLQAAGAAA